MSDETPRLKLPQLVSLQEMNQVTWNEALAQIDALVDLCLLGRFVDTPPASPSDGDAYIVGGAPAGAWAGYAYKIAVCLDGAWRFYTPFNGLRAFVPASGAFIVYLDGAWIDWNALIAYQPAPDFPTHTMAQYLDDDFFTRGISISRVTNFGAFTSWPQGGTAVKDGKLYVKFTAGSAHVSTDKQSYLTYTRDGLGFAEPWIMTPALVSGTLDNTSVWAFGADAAGNFWQIAYCSPYGNPSARSFRLRKSVDNGVTWTDVLNPIPFVDNTATLPTMYHSFCELSNGKLAFCYHFESGRTGVIMFDPATYAYTTKDVYTEGQNLEDIGVIQCEASLVREPVSDTVLVYFRTTRPGYASDVVKTTDNFSTFTKASTNIVETNSTIAPLIYDDHIWLFTCDRYTDPAEGNAAHVKAYIAPLASALALNASSFVSTIITEVPAIASSLGSSWTGQAAVAVLNDVIHCFISAGSSENTEQTDIYDVRLDRRPIHRRGHMSHWSRDVLNRNVIRGKSLLLGEFSGSPTSACPIELHKNGISGNSAQFRLWTNSDNVSGGANYLNWLRNGGNTNTWTETLNGMHFGRLDAQGVKAGGTGSARAAVLACLQDGASTATGVPGMWDFQTSDGTNPTASRFRIRKDGKIWIAALPMYANNAAALAGGLEGGMVYRTGGDPDLICYVH